MAPVSMCSPYRRCHKRKSGSCLTLDDLGAIAQLYLAGANSPALGQVLLSYRRAAEGPALSAEAATTHHAALLRGLRRVMGPLRPEHEWPDMRFIAQGAPPDLRRRLTAAFRPPHPVAWLHNPRMWLTSLDIEASLRQYEDSRFRFLGVFPIDFALRLDSGARCVSPRICDLDIQQQLSLQPDMQQIGAVFNLDKHTQSGTHWVALHAGLDPTHAASYGVSYYDSVARRPPPQITAFMQRMRQQMAAAYLKPFAIQHNILRKQFGNTECGVFAINFIVQSIPRTHTFHQVCANVGRDSDMNDMRKLLFRAPSPRDAQM